MSTPRPSAATHLSAVPRAVLASLALIWLLPTWAASFRVHPEAGSDIPDGLTWSTAFPTVQAGVDRAEEGDEVWVAAGLYTGQVRLKAGVALYGGFAGVETRLDERNWTEHLSVLDGGKTNTVVVVAAGATNTTRIDGFTIQNGVTTRSGGGVVCSNASPVIENNLIRTNRATMGGGIHTLNSFAIIRSNTITGNVAGDRGAGLHFSYSAPVVEGNTILGNRATLAGTSFAGGIYCGRPPTAETNRAVLILGNLIQGNLSSGGGGGIECDDRSRVVIRRNVIARNRANSVGGGVEIYQATVTLERNLIAGNVLNASEGATSGLGGAGVGVFGLSLNAGSARMENNVLLGNVNVGSRAEGGGIWNKIRATHLYHNTLLGNVAAEGGGIHDSGGAQIANCLVAFGRTGVVLASGTSFSNNCVYSNSSCDYAPADLAGQQGNFSADPRLTADFARGEFHLAPDSPCRDAGDARFVSGDALDYDGQARVQGAGVDIGADEFDGVGATVPARVVRVSPEGDDARDGASWERAKRTVQAGLEAAAAPGGEVWVKAGTYAENLVLPYLAHLYGGFSGSETNRDERDARAQASVLDGQNRKPVIDGCDGATAYNGGTFLTVDGFVVQNGVPIDGGGISCKDSLRARIRDNLVRWNTSTNRSAGAGGIYLTGDRLEVTGNTVVSNACPGRAGGVHLSGSLDLRNNFLGANRLTTNAFPNLPGGPASALYVAPGSTGRLVNNSVIGNGNAAGETGSVVAAAPNLLVANNLVAFNSSGVSAYAGDPTYRHNCVFGNTNFNYAGLTDPTGADGNFSAEPHLADPEGFRLVGSSPCVDAGDDTDSDPDGFDLEGEPRMMGVRVDIGADEFTQPGIWQRVSDPAPGIRFATTNAGGLTYGTFEVTLPDSCHRLLGIGLLEHQDSGFRLDVRLALQTGGACLPVATVSRTNLVLGALSSADYALRTFSWDSPVLTNAFTVAASPEPTLIPLEPTAEGWPAFRAAGVPEVRYVIEASPDLSGWSQVKTQIGAPFEFTDPDAVARGHRFFRVRVGP